MMKKIPLSFLKNPRGFYRIAAALLPALLLTQACLKDDFDKLKQPTWRPIVAFPLINSTLTIKDIVNKFDSGGLVSEGPDKFLTIIYKGFLSTDPAESLLVIPSQSASKAFTMGPVQITQLAGSGTYDTTITATVNFTLTDTAQHLNLVKLKRGNLHIHITNSFQHPATVIITVPSLKKNSIAFTKTYPVTAAPPPADIMDDVDLSGYEMDLTLSGSSYNKLPVDARITLTNSGAPVNPGDQFTFDFQFDNLGFSYIEGYLGQLPFALPEDTIDANFFRNTLGGSIAFEDPRFRVALKNSYGLPIEINFNKMTARSSATGSTMNLTAPFIPGPVTVNAPNFSQVGQYAITNLSMDKSNSNVKTVMTINPDEMIYLVGVKSNPAGNTGNNFILDTSRIDMDFELELPLYGTVNDLVVQDTLRLDLPTMDEIESMLVKINTDNGFPMDADLQIYFTDSLYSVTDSLIDVGASIIQSAPVDANGIVTAPYRATSVITLSGARMNNMKKGKFMIVKAVLETTAGGSLPVKIYSDYNLDVKLSIKANLKIE
jgi:hypothetical protein